MRCTKSQKKKPFNFRVSFGLFRLLVIHKILFETKKDTQFISVLNFKLNINTLMSFRV